MTKRSIAVTLALSLGMSLLTPAVPASARQTIGQVLQRPQQSLTHLIMKKMWTLRKTSATEKL